MASGPPRLGATVTNETMAKRRDSTRTRRLCDGPTLMRAFRGAVANLASNVDGVNALNVFPVPDGDTGSNMLATVRSALAEAEALPEMERTLERVAEALSFGALVGARGNSGLILSQVLRGMAEATRGKRRAVGADLVVALRRGAETAYGAVARPVEGTILTVAREAAEAADWGDLLDPGVEIVLKLAVGGAERSVARTPLLLPVLHEAGVVDSGGQGLYLLLRGLLLELADATGPELTQVHFAPPPMEWLPGHGADAYGYETMFLLTAGDAPLDVPALSRELDAIGESVMVAGDERAARVHVHNANPDRVLALGLSRGTLTAITIENLDQQAHALATSSAGPRDVAASALDLQPPGASHRPTVRPPAVAARPATLAVVAVVPGRGFARAYASLGAATVGGGRSANPSTREIADAIRATGANSVIVLSNDANVHLVARHAATLCKGVEALVVPTRNAAEGLAAVLALDTRRTPEQNAATMLDAARGLQTLHVTRAVRGATMGRRKVRSGQAIALDPDDGLLAVGEDQVETCLEGLGCLRPGFELLTIYRGVPAEAGEASRLVARIAESHPGVEVELIDGGQPHYAYLIAAE
jgi:DAK2 domain fusion protein YloV